MTKENTINRRDFIKLGLVGLATTTAAVGFTVENVASDVSKADASSVNSPKESKYRWGMVIDQSKCNGCGYCVKACHAHNDVAPDRDWARIIATEPVGDKEVYLPVPCMHCQDAPCVHICPVGASYHRPDGIVMMDYDRCIGCRYCELACPYGARSFNWEEFTGDNPVVPKWGQPEVARRPRGVAEKCSFCYQRIDRGLEYGLTPGVDQAATPACVVACPSGARLFGDLNDPDSPVSRALAGHSSYRLREDLGTDPSVYYLPATDDEEIYPCTENA